MATTYNEDGTETKSIRERQEAKKNDGYSQRRDV